MEFGALAFEVTERHAASATAPPGLALLAALGQRPYAEAHQGLAVAAEVAEARADQDLADLLGEARLDLDDAGIVRVRSATRPLQELALVIARGIQRELLELVALRQHARRDL